MHGYRYSYSYSPQIQINFQLSLSLSLGLSLPLSLSISLYLPARVLMAAAFNVSSHVINLNLCPALCAPLCCLCSLSLAFYDLICNLLVVRCSFHAPAACHTPPCPLAACDFLAVDCGSAICGNDASGPHLAQSMRNMPPPRYAFRL